MNSTNKLTLPPNLFSSNSANSLQDEIECATATISQTLGEKHPLTPVITKMTEAFFCSDEREVNIKLASALDFLKTVRGDQIDVNFIACAVVLYLAKTVQDADRTSLAYDVCVFISTIAFTIASSEITQKNLIKLACIDNSYLTHLIEYAEGTMINQNTKLLQFAHAAVQYLESVVHAMDEENLSKSVTTPSATLWHTFCYHMQKISHFSEEHAFLLPTAHSTAQIEVHTPSESVNVILFLAHFQAISCEQHLNDTTCLNSLEPFSLWPSKYSKNDTVRAILEQSPAEVVLEFFSQTIQQKLRQNSTIFEDSSPFSLIPYFESTDLSWLELILSRTKISSPLYNKLLPLCLEYHQDKPLLVVRIITTILKLNEFIGIDIFNVKATIKQLHLFLETNKEGLYTSVYSQSITSLLATPWILPSSLEIYTGAFKEDIFGEGSIKKIFSEIELLSMPVLTEIEKRLNLFPGSLREGCISACIVSLCDEIERICDKRHILSAHLEKLERVRIPVKNEVLHLIYHLFSELTIIQQKVICYHRVKKIFNLTITTRSQIELIAKPVQPGACTWKINPQVAPPQQSHILSPTPRRPAYHPTNHNFTNEN